MPAIALLMLVERGKLDLSAPVARYWKEFAGGGKGDITVEDLIAARAGVLYADAAPAGSFADVPAMLAAVEVQPPERPAPGCGAYHSVTSGLLNAELLRRVDGRDFRTFYDEEMRSPLGAELYIGLDDAELDRVSPIVPNTQSTTLNLISGGQHKLARAWRVLPKPLGEFVNEEAFRRAVFASASFHGNARGLAAIYAAMMAPSPSRRLLSGEMVDEARRQRWAGKCGMTDRNFRYGLGVFLPQAPDMAFSPNDRAFGHPGAGGALGFADPEAGLAFGYVPNHMCAGQGLGDRCEALTRALYDCIS